MLLDTLLAIGSCFDWVTPTLAFVQDQLFGPPAYFGVATNPIYGRSEIKRLLKHYGIRVWGVMYNFKGDFLMLTTPRYQANLAYSIMVHAGVPVLYAPRGVTASLVFEWNGQLWYLGD